MLKLMTLGAVALGVACPAMAAVQESFTVDASDGAFHSSDLGNTDNGQTSFTATGGYTLGDLNFSGTLQPVESGSWGSEAVVHIVAPNGVGVVAQLGNGQALGGPTQFSGTIDAFVGIDPAGEWSIEYYDTFDDGAGPDAEWVTLTWEFTDDNNVPAPGSPDMRFCELYGLTQFGASGAYPNRTVALSVATTSWNIGDKNLLWKEEPDSRHPVIAMNLFRHRTDIDRFEQIGQSWLKHGFFALSNEQCGIGDCDDGQPVPPGCSGTDGTFLGVGCTDTYTAGLNASQSGLGPRYEVDPWTGEWLWTGSVFDPRAGGPSNSSITRRLQVNEQDLLTPNSNYYVEGYYVIADDVETMNNAAWKPVTPNDPGGDSNWSFSMSGSGTCPNVGFAVDAWPGATQTIIAQEVPVDEAASPDGRCILAAKAVSTGARGATTRYEYFLYNVDMDAQVGSFSIPIDADTNIIDSGFHAVFHHDEPVNTVDPDGVAISNSDWTVTQTATEITWSTTDNPLRWGTGYTFWFETDRAPTTTTATLGHFRSADVPTVSGETVGPEVLAACEGDVDGSGAVDANDISFVIFRLGDTGTPGEVEGDANGDGVVDSNDISFVIFRLGPC